MLLTVSPLDSPQIGAEYDIEKTTSPEREKEPVNLDTCAIRRMVTNGTEVEYL